MSLKIVNQIQEKIKRECFELKNVDPWIYDEHLLAVFKNAKFILNKLPKANREVVLLGVWLHDIQSIRGIRGDHQKSGAIEAGKIMFEYNYPSKIIKQVQDIISTHSCDQSTPKTLEGKILATADAMAHYDNDFYLRVATTKKQNLQEYKDWALEKLNRDYYKKIFFTFAKNKVKLKHQTLMKLFTMK